MQTIRLAAFSVVPFASPATGLLSSVPCACGCLFRSVCGYVCGCVCISPPPPVIPLALLLPWRQLYMMVEASREPSTVRLCYIRRPQATRRSSHPRRSFNTKLLFRLHCQSDNALLPLHKPRTPARSYLSVDRLPPVSLLRFKRTRHRKKAGGGSRNRCTPLRDG